ncbi:MAG: SDR family NAD(P)-dependent oxidoreductase [Deltaproteobacteria bacterium]|jgi:NAD(P)-dependent dehydrogenase (short-subunit alcohol dehydrogenase family)|nr:SDR family NAD(P)-dependent oxidoreductase [Deltaproteobacteria bacterium]
MGELDRSVVLVTGATRGIGRGCALELAAHGATVYATGRTQSEGESELPGSLDSLESEARTLGGRVIGLVCDHRDDANVARVFDRIRDEAGRLDLLVNNAFLLPDGIEPDRPFWETPISWWDDMIDVGTRSAYVALHHAARLMVEAGSGLVVNISSAGARALHLHVAYSAGKSALDRITCDAATQLRAHGVSVVSLWPYFVRTERLMRIEEEAQGEWDHDIEGAESQRFVGRTIAALARAPDLAERSGAAFTTVELALAYGVRDEGGALPGGPRSAQG